jgi:hypothetical protein
MSIATLRTLSRHEGTTGILLLEALLVETPMKREFLLEMLQTLLRKLLLISLITSLKVLKTCK